MMEAVRTSETSVDNHFNIHLLIQAKVLSDPFLRDFRDWIQASTFLICMHAVCPANLSYFYE